MNRYTFNTTASMQHQDWTPIVLSKKKAVAAPPGTKGASIAKGTASNKQTSGAVVNIRKLEDETNPAQLPQISTEFKLQIAQARQAKGWTQKELAVKINERATLVADYEAGRAIPDQRIITKMSKALGTQLKK